jgi:DNA-3-methyladenine glycosylase II
MADLIARSRRYKIVPPVSVRPFDALAESIAYQQLSGKAAATIFGRVRALYPKRKWLDPEQLLATPDETLRAAGLSRAKTAALKDLAAKTIDGTVPSGRALIRMSDDEIVARLTTVRGIGRWTVEMLLLFDLGRPDVWPVDDYGVRKGFAKTFGRRKLPTPKQLMKFGEKWRPYRSVAAWYFWRALDQPEKLKIEKLTG